MGLFDFFTGKGGGNLAKTVTAANNKYAMSADRYKAMERLRDAATDEALLGLLRRFTWNYDKTIEDEQEKESVHDWLVAMASDQDLDEKERAEQRERVIRALEKSAASSETISWQLRVMSHIASHEELWPSLEKVIAANDNEYVRDPSRKIQLVTFLGESFVDERATRALLQWLTDVDETVRYNAVEAVLHHKNEELGREPLLKLLLTSDEESRRIRVRVLDGLADVGWTTHGWKGEVEAKIAELGLPHSIDNKGRVKKR